MRQKHEQYKRFYEGLTRPLKAHPRLIRALSIVDKAIAISFVIAYPTFLAVLLFSKPFRLLLALNAIGLPFLCFACVTMLRKLIKRPRPYETTGAGIEPLIKKRGTGNSMPSRHIASAFVISLTILPHFLWAGIACLAAATVLSVLRWFEGVHYPSDLLAGALLGIAFGCVGLIL